MSTELILSVAAVIVTVVVVVIVLIGRLDVRVGDLEQRLDVYERQGVDAPGYRESGPVGD